MQEVESCENTKHAQLDRLGIFVSSACIAHCLLLPLLLITLPFLEIFLKWHLLIHAAILGLALPIAWSSLKTGYLHHRRLLVPFFGCLGALLILTSFLLDLSLPLNHTEHFNHAGNLWNLPLSFQLSLLGGAFLVVAHSINLTTCHSGHSHFH